MAPLTSKSGPMLRLQDMEFIPLELDLNEALPCLSTPTM